jgi:hypothetical protein
MRSLIEKLQPHKARIARLIGMGGVLIVASVLIRGAPRTVDVEIELGPLHRQFVELRIAYVHEGQELHGALFAFPNGAPGSLKHSVQLPAGDFEVHTQLRPEHGKILASVGRLHAPSDGLVVIRVGTPTETQPR